VDYGEHISYETLAPGTPVVGSDGAEVGTVRHVLADDSVDVFDGLVIEVGGTARFADADEVGEIYERAVILKVSAADALELPEPVPAPAVMESHGVEDSEGPVMSKLHRAWDLISGNY